MALLVLAAAIRLAGLDAEYFWFDEQFSANVIDAPPGEIIRRVSGDAHPPLFYLALHYYQKLLPHSTIFTLRLFPFFWGIAGLALLYGFGRRFISGPTALWALGLGAVLNFHVDYSQELRAYTVVISLTLASNYFLMMGLKSKSGRRRNFLLSAAANTLGIFTHYHVIFFIAAQGAFLAGWCWRKRQWGDLGDWVFVMALGMLAYSAWLPYQIRQLYFTNIYWVPPVTFWSVALFPVGTVLLWGINGIFTLRALEFALIFTVILVVLWAFGRKPRGDGSPGVAFPSALWLMAATSFGPIMLVVAASLIYQNFFYPRYLIYVSSGILLLIGYALTRMKPRWAVAAFGLIAAMNVILVVFNYQTRSKDEWHLAFDQAVSQTGPDGLYIFHSEAIHSAFVAHTKIQVPMILINDVMSNLEAISKIHPESDVAVFLYLTRYMNDDFPTILLRMISDDWQKSNTGNLSLLQGQRASLGEYVERRRERESQLSRDFLEWWLPGDPEIGAAFDKLEADGDGNMYRWSNGPRGTLLLSTTLPPGEYEATWEVNLWRPDSAPKIQLAIAANGSTWKTITEGAGPLSIRGPVSIGNEAGKLRFDFEVSTWRPSVHMADSVDERDLGFMISVIGIKNIDEKNHE